VVGFEVVVNMPPGDPDAVAVTAEAFDAEALEWPNLF
jgi:hypothetical protein